MRGCAEVTTTIEVFCQVC